MFLLGIVDTQNNPATSIRFTHYLATKVFCDEHSSNNGWGKSRDLYQIRNVKSEIGNLKSL
jgi:hypothetical protein